MHVQAMNPSSGTLPESHDAVGAVECLFYTITVVDVDIDVQDARVDLKELEDCQNNVVDIAEAGRLRLLSVVEPPGPVNGYVSVVIVEADGTVYGGASIELGELEEAVKDRAVCVLPGVELLHLRGVLAEVVWGHLSEEIDVVLGVEGCHLLRACGMGPVALHFTV